MPDPIDEIMAEALGLILGRRARDCMHIVEAQRFELSRAGYTIEPDPNHLLAKGQEHGGKVK